MAKNPTCDICGGTKLVVSYPHGEQMQQGRIEGVTKSFGFNICSTSTEGTTEVCGPCARSLRDAVSSAVFQLKRPTVMSHV
jgi:hypothetical protein